MINSKHSIIATTLTISVFLSLTQPSLSASIFRLKPSSPKDLLEGIYNNALAGNDRLTDIENYMSASLKADYRRAVKISKKGGKCELPRVLINGIFSRKIKGFKVDSENGSTWTTQAKVRIDTEANNLPSTSLLKKFDPNVYEVISFNFKRRFIDWKIDNIQASTPDLDNVSNGVNYKLIDLRDALKSCKYD
jgi:hypothetical protein